MYRFSFRELLISILVLLAVAGGYCVSTRPPGCVLPSHCGLLAAE